MRVSLLTINGSLLTQVVVPVESNTFQAEVTVPITITGAAQIQVQVLDNTDTVSAVDTLERYSPMAEGSQSTESSSCYQAGAAELKEAEVSWTKMK